MKTHLVGRASRRRRSRIGLRFGIAINQFITTALAEKMSALLTAEYLGERAQRGSRRKFERVLGKVRDVPPTEGDEL